MTQPTSPLFLCTLSFSTPLTLRQARAAEATALTNLNASEAQFQRKQQTLRDAESQLQVCLAAYSSAERNATHWTSQIAEFYQQVQVLTSMSTGHVEEGRATQLVLQEIQSREYQLTRLVFDCQRRVASLDSLLSCLHNQAVLRT